MATNNTVYGINAPLVITAPPTKQVSSAPSSVTIGYPIGQILIVKGATPKAYILLAKTTTGNVTTANWSQIDNASGGGAFATLTVNPGPTSLTGVFLTAGGAASINASSNFSTSINTGTSTGAVSIGNASAGALTLASGADSTITSASASATALILEASDATGALRVRAGSGGIIIGDDADTGAISIGNATSGALTLASGAASSITSAAASATALVLEASNAAGGIDVRAGSAGIGIGNEADTAVVAISNITPTAARAVTLGAGTVATAITDTINVGVGGVSTNAGATKVVNVGSGNVLVGSQTINIGSGTAATGTHAINIGTGTGGGTKTVVVGNADGLTSISLRGSQVQVVAATDTQASPTATAVINARVGAATFTGFTTASGAAEVFTITNSVATATSVIICTASNEGANDAQMFVSRVERGVGTFDVTVTNDGAAALNGDVTIAFWILN